ncbi:MAG: NAD(P)-dependent oxidoreductase [Bacteroidales bacterium]|nr:NAD(P)-dependent oxidoreductase [Candidatus Physcocola equi]
MRISIIGSNGMLSAALTKGFFEAGNIVDVYGLDAPVEYPCTNFFPTNLLKDEMNYDNLVKSDMIVYAAGAGVQAALSTPSSLMYSLNVSVPIGITLNLKSYGYKGVFITFGSYMEIGINDEEKAFKEDDVICSTLPVSNDYALSKRLFGRYMRDLICEFKYWHFILPNMFSYNDLKPGTRLIPYTLEYIKKYLSGEETVDPSYSAGFQTRQFILLEDLLIVLSKSVEKNIPSGIYNVGGGKYMSIRNLIESIFAYYHVPCKDSFFGQSVRRDGDIKCLRLNGDKLKSSINYLPNTEIEDVLTKFSNS